jgi:hypothetical protein
MKKNIFVTIIVSLILALTACGSTQSSNCLLQRFNTLSHLEGQLLVGTFKLEDTTLEVTSAKQASHPAAALGDIGIAGFQQHGCFAGG